MSKEQGPAESPMASSNGQKYCKMCGHGMWGCHCGHRHFWIRLVLGLIILFVVFWVGVKVGEFKSEFGRGFYGSRSHMMMRYSPSPLMRAYPLGNTPSGMMQGGSGRMMTPGAATTTTSITPAK